MTYSIQKAALAAVSLLSILQLSACSPQTQSPNYSRTEALLASARTAVQPAGGLRPEQAMSYRPSNFGIQNQNSAPRVLMVIANQDFWYADYALPRQALEAQGIQVSVAAATLATAFPHAHSGEGADGGAVQPDLSLMEAQADDYDAILFVGGWGASAYQFAFDGQYQNPHYNGSQALRNHTNDLIQDFVQQDKYVSALCHGVTVLAWARIGGASLLAGRQVTGWNGAAPQTQGNTHPTQARAHIENNGAQMLASGAVGDPQTVSDDVIISGRIITAQDYRSGTQLGQTLAQQLLSEHEQETEANPTPTPSPTPSPLPSPSPTPQTSPSSAPTTEPDASPTPEPSAHPRVLMVIANRDFYYREYAEPLAAFGSAGIEVSVAAENIEPSYPHPNTGEGADGGEVLPDLRLDQVQASDYDALVFVGGWGSSQYQFAAPYTYNNGYYNGNTTTKAVVNELINDFATQDKYVMGICHAASVLAWARIDGQSPLAGRQATGGPWLPSIQGQGPMETRDYIEANQGIYVPSRSVGDPTTSADDLVIDGKFITVEDYDTAHFAGSTLAQLLLAE